MQLALLGADPEALSIAAALLADPQHRLVWACQVEAAAPLLRAEHPALRISPAWEELLESGGIDAAIVARLSTDDPAAAQLRPDQLRKLVQSGLPLLVVHPIDRSMLFCYELEMIRKAAGGQIVPYLPLRHHPGIEHISSRLKATDHQAWGRPVQLSIERRLPRADRLAVLDCLAHDLDLARHWCGELTRLSAMAPGDEPGRWSQLSVQLSSASGTLVRWSQAPLEPGVLARIVIATDSAQATLLLFAKPNQWRCDWENSGQQHRTESTATGPDERLPPSAASRALKQLADAIQGVTTEPSWLDACRAVELAEAVERSLKKGRTLELHYEDYTEQGTFKGTMTSLGCGLLLLSLGVLLAAAVTLRLGLPVGRYWAYFLVLVLALFLLLQTLRLVFQADKRRDID